MSDHYAGTDPWAEVPEAMGPPTPEVPDRFRDGDDDFDYEAYDNANRTAAAARADERSAGARHSDEGRRTIPATPLFDGALKARQAEMSTVADRDRAGRVKGFLEKIRTTETKNDVGLNESNSTRGLEHSRDRGHGRGR